MAALRRIGFLPRGLAGWGVVLVPLLFAVFCANASAQNLQPIPPLTSHVVDTTGTLDAVEVKGLEDRLMAFEQAKGSQMAILMVATTQPEDIASYANRVGNSWKIGRKGVGDGVLIVVAKDDRKVRIEVAKALEGAIPDVAALHVIDDAIRPAFRTGDYAGGLRAGVDQLIARINGEALPEPPRQPKSAKPQVADKFDWTDLAIFFLVAVPVVGGILRRIFGRPLGAVVAGAGIGALAWLVTTSVFVALLAGILGLFFTLVSGFGGFIPMGGGGFGGGFGGFGGGRGGGGGGGSSWGGSGGGGDFGGGGASGDW